MGFYDDNTSGARIEKEFEPMYNTWLTDRSPANTGVLLKALEPTVNKGLSSFVGRNAGSVMRGHAKRLALQALDSYDPKVGKLGTHVMNHLQGLQRINRKATQVIRIPERVIFDHAYLEENRKQMAEELGRDPSTAELADRTGLSVKRIAKLRTSHLPVAEGTLQAISGEDGISAFNPAVDRDRSIMAVEAVYGDLDGMGQQIMEWTLGLHGSPMLSNQEIAQKLKLSASAVSQRKAVIQKRLDAMLDIGLF